MKISFRYFVWRERNNFYKTLKNKINKKQAEISFFIFNHFFAQPLVKKYKALFFFKEISFSAGLEKVQNKTLCVILERQHCVKKKAHKKGMIVSFS